MYGAVLYTATYPASRRRAMLIIFNTDCFILALVIPETFVPNSIINRTIQVLCMQS